MRVRKYMQTIYLILISLAESRRVLWIVVLGCSWLWRSLDVIAGFMPDLQVICRNYIVAGSYNFL